MCSNYLILSMRQGNGIAIWWKPRKAGYTTDVNQAGRYTQAEAEEIQRLSQNQDIAVSPSDFNALDKRLVVDMGDGNNWAEMLSRHPEAQFG